MFELSGVNYEEVLEQGDSILVRVIARSSNRGFELLGLYCILNACSLQCTLCGRRTARRSGVVMRQLASLTRLELGSSLA